MLALDAEVAVVTNIELDHHATYGSLAEVHDVFDAFRARRAGARRRAASWRATGDTVFAPEELVLEPGGSRFAWRGHEVVLQVPGAHNARNAAAALEACRLAGAADLGAAVAALATSRARAAGSSAWGRLRPARSSSTTTRTTRPRSRRRSPPRGRWSRGGSSRSSSRTVLPDPAAPPRVRCGAGGGRVPSRSTSTRRASGPRTSRASTAS